MGNFKVSDYVIGVVVFTFVVVGCIAFIQGFDNVDPKFSEDDTFESFNKSVDIYDDVIAETDRVSGSIDDTTAGEEGAESGWGIFGIIDSLIGSVWNTIKLTISSLDFMDDVFKGIAKTFALPTWVATMIISIITLLLAYAIFALVFQRDT